MKMTQEALNIVFALHKEWLLDSSKGERANISGADLSGADLSEANLSQANLSRTDLRWADLSGANLSGANLSQANLSWANLPLKVGVDPTLKARILEKVEAEGCKLEMADWHTCETTHCLAGWAVVLSGEAGKVLEAKSTTYLAGRLLLGLDAEEAEIFFEDGETAMTWLRS